MPDTLWTIYKHRFEPKKDAAGNITSVPEPEDPVEKMLGAAKDQISILTTLFAGGYFALISISDINDVKAVLKDQPILLKVGAIFFIALPMFCWLISLIYAK